MIETLVRILGVSAAITVAAILIVLALMAFALWTRTRLLLRKGERRRTEYADDDTDEIEPVETTERSI